MSSKEDKKTKKKKTAKSAEGKTEDNVKAETAVKEDTVKEEVVNKTDETLANVEESVEKDESMNDAPENQTEPVSDDSKRAEPIENDAKDDRKSSKADSKRGSKMKEKEVIKSRDIEKLVELREAFSLFDFNHDGIIDLQDLKYTFASMGKPDYPEEEMKRMLKEATEPVDFDAFVSLFGYKVSTLDTEDDFSNALATWDMRGVGMIPEGNLKKDMQCFGDKFSGKETDTALEEAPVYVNEGTSMIDYLKFSSNICGFRNVERTRRYQKELENAQAQK